MYKPRLKARAHQREALHRITQMPMRPSRCDVFALLMEMGTGKSKVVLDEFGERVDARDLTDLLVIAPAGSYRNWFEDQGEFPSEMRKQLDPELFGRIASAGWVSGGNAAARARLEHVLGASGPRALFVNVEAVGTVDKAYAACEQFLERGRAMLVVDESTRIKNPKAGRSAAVCRLGQLACARRIMSGLVSPNSPLDLFSQFNFLDWRILGFKSFYSFRARYAVLEEMTIGGVTDPYTGIESPSRNIIIPVAYRNVEELNQKIAPYSFRKLKSECLDLPPKIYLPPREVKLTDEQRRIYLEMREFAVAKLAAEAYVNAQMVITQRIRLDQILCGFVPDEEGNLHEIKENRTAALLEDLEECEGKAIIWTTHDHCVRKLAARIEKEFGEGSVARFWGGNRSKRHIEEARFKGDPTCRFMVATQSAGGVGNNWQVAGLSCYYNNDDNLEHRLQSEDRVHRDGLRHSAVYQDYIARGTIDERKVHNLRNKLNLSSIVNGDNYRQWLI